MAQLPQLTECPNCSEPLESGDRFCGVCGADITAPLPEPPAADPAHNGSAPAQAAGDQNITDSFRLAPAMPTQPPAVGAGPEEPESDGYRLAAPEQDPEHYRIAEPPVGADPRTALGASPAGAEALPDGAKLCVACRTGTVDADGYCENCGHAQPRARDHMESEIEGGTGGATVTDRGLRHHRNEDFYALSTVELPNGATAVISVVCDGVSSATRPDEASEAASIAGAESLSGSLGRGVHPQQAMHEALLTAAQSVSALADEPHARGVHQNAPACTCVSAVISAGILTIGWIGDSRAYWIPDDRSAPSARLTEDDSWAAQMVAAGLMSEADAYADQRAHAITGWLGADAHELDPHTASFKPDGPGVVVVCTDGLWNYAEAAEEMAAAVPADARSRPLHSAQVLVGHALDGGGHDNVTVAVLPFPAT